MLLQTHNIEMKIKVIALKGFRLTEGEIKFLKILSKDSFFEESVLALRKLLKLPQDPLKDKTRPLFAQSIDSIKTAASALKSVYKNLPEYWAFIFTYIIRDGIAYPPLTKEIWLDISFVSGTGLTVNPEDYEPEPKVQITIRKKISFKKLVQELNKRKNELDQALNRLPNDPDIKQKNIDPKLFIEQLRKKGRKFPEIAEALGKKYKGRLTFDLGYETVALEYSRFKKGIKKYLEKDREKVKFFNWYLKNQRWVEKGFKQFEKRNSRKN